MNSDNSHTERIRRMRERTMASWRRTAPLGTPEQGVGGGIVDESTRMARALGQKPYTIQLDGVLNGSTKITTGPCCPTQ